eukprot:Blabericola_migrator_1__2448@NODE_168_length_12126_cov_91_620864_g146_i0_p8_GENE_NODE_168_length_12126_cov_91_620864_g146_i0NODE_168_length_12126_cov_91_620864_g146_i0_p8_ORF_typecomplete_len137_score16_14_NODE_168_length_12126_cov_91_620864_g146_i07417
MIKSIIFLLLGLGQGQRCPFFGNWKLQNQSWPEFPSSEVLQLSIEGFGGYYQITARSANTYVAVLNAVAPCSGQLTHRLVMKKTFEPELSVSEIVAGEQTRKMLNNIAGLEVLHNTKQLVLRFTVLDGEKRVLFIM